jgi:hypothetical protein
VPESDSEALLFEKEAKTFAWLWRISRRQPRKSFLVLFFKKEPLASRRNAATGVNPSQRGLLS